MRRMDVRGGSLAERTPLSLGSRLRGGLGQAQTMVEYALLLSLVALALVGTIGGMAGQIGGRFNAISNTLASGGNGGLGGGGTTTPGGGGTVTPPPTTGTGNNSGGSNGTNPDGTVGNTGMTKPEIDKIIDEGADKGLDGISWRQLSKLSPYAATHKDEFYDWIGTTKSVLVDGMEVKMRLVGIAQDDLADGSGKAGFSFLSTNYFVSNSYFAAMAVNDIVSWNSSIVRDQVKDIYDNKLTDINMSNMKRYIKTVAKISSGSNLKTLKKELVKTDDQLWYPSSSELFGTRSESSVLFNIADNGAQYDYFNDNSVSIGSTGNVNTNGRPIINGNVLKGSGLPSPSSEIFVVTRSMSLEPDYYGSNLKSVDVIAFNSGTPNVLTIIGMSQGPNIRTQYYVFGFCV